MSAVRLGAEASEGNNSCQTHRFQQKVPIPSYLLAIVGGDLESRSVKKKKIIIQGSYSQNHPSGLGSAAYIGLTLHEYEGAKQQVVKAET
jgi:hypothetical protein